MRTTNSLERLVRIVSLDTAELNLSEECALRRHEGLFAGARIIGVVGFASAGESYDCRLQRNPHLTDLAPLPQRPSLAWVGDGANRQCLEYKSGRPRCALKSSLPTSTHSRSISRVHGPALPGDVESVVAATHSTRIQRFRIFVSFPLRADDCIYSPHGFLRKI